MNLENRRKVATRIREAADALSGKLPRSARHPKGRNPYAHIPSVIKSIVGESYTTAPDKLFDDILQIIDYCEQNPF